MNEKLENNEGEVVVNNEYPSLDVDKEDNKSNVKLENNENDMANLDSCLAFIFGCLDDQEKLEKRLELKQKECEKDTTNVENEINQISQELDEKKKITSATSFKKALEYVKMLDCVKRGSEKGGC